MLDSLIADMNLLNWIWVGSFCLVLMGCQSKYHPTESVQNPTEAVHDSAGEPQSVVEPQATEGVDEIPCVFNPDLYTLTTKWAQDLGISVLYWDEEEGYVVSNLQLDTLRLKQGGCNHFVYYAEIRYYDSQVPLEGNTDFWVQKGIELASIVSFLEYEASLGAGKYTILREGPRFLSIFPEVADDTGMVYVGLEVSHQQDYTRLSLSQYFN
ncbi:MAG TPA: hypothetical protein DCR93_25080 [Cytophagales bacterium]|nr:hypothetical protein [Cytophagales bacterium]HAP62632.1 hypothetical protein [Cytophagales bacterium]